MNIKICFAFQISSQNHETNTIQRDGTSVDGTKGQLISKWCLKFSKKTTKKLTNFFKRIKACHKKVHFLMVVMDYLTLYTVIEYICPSQFMPILLVI